MRIEVTSHDPPWPYAASKYLNPPPPESTFDSFIERLSAFSRVSILDTGSRLLWQPWLQDMGPANSAARAIPETQGPEVIGLSMIFGDAVGGVHAEAVDFNLLTWELFSLRSFADPEDPQAAIERTRLASRWLPLLRGTAFERLDAGALVTRVRGLWMRGRLLADQSARSVSLSNDVLRVLLLLEGLEAVAPVPSALRTYLRAYFSDEPIRLLRQAVGVAGHVKKAAAHGLCPGRLDVFKVDEDNPDVADLALFGRLACTSSSALSSMRARLQELREGDKKLSVFARPLALRPGIVLDEYTDRRAFSFPSPPRLLRSLHRLFVDDFIAFVDQQVESAGRLGVPAPALLGQAVHHVMRDALSGRMLVIDDAECPVVGKKPDAVWFGERFGILVEAKARVTPRSDPELDDPDSLLETWRRCWEAVEQASAFVNNAKAREWLQSVTTRRPAMWVLAIVVDEVRVAERSAFRHATSHWGLLPKALEGVALVTFDFLDAAVATQTPDAVGEAIRGHWRDSGRDALQQPPEEPPAASGPRPAYLERAYQRLLKAD